MKRIDFIIMNIQASITRLWAMMLAIIMPLAFVSCSDDDYVNAIPDNVQLLMSLNTVKVSGVGNPLVLKSLLHVSKVSDTGLDLSERVFLFEDAQGNLGLCAKLDDSGKLAKTLEHANVEVRKKRGFQFAALPSNWVIGFSDKAALLMGPVVPSAQADMMTLMSRYLAANEDEGIKGSPVYDKLDSIDAPMALVCQVKALPQQFAALFTMGTPKNANPADVMLAAAMEVQNGRLLMRGGTFSFKKPVNNALVDACAVYRPIKGNYARSMSENDFIGLFLNVDGKSFHRLVTQNRGIAAMLAGINSAIDMDNILKSVDGDLAILVPNATDRQGFSLRMTAKLSSAPWLADVGYWKQSVPKGGYIGDWGENRFFYRSTDTSYYFGVTSDMQYMSGGSEEEALRSVKASELPIPADLQKMIEGQKLVMIVNLNALTVSKAEVLPSLLKPVFGKLSSIVYILK